MRPQLWLPVVVFLAVSVPVVLLLGALDIGGDWRVWIALVAGGLAMAVTQRRLGRSKGDQD